MQRCTMSRQAGLDLQCENPDDDLGAIRPADYGTRSAIMMSEATLHIRKATGELVPFDEMRLRSALERSGAGEELIEEVTHAVMKELVEGMSTRTIYKKAFARLRSRSKRVAGRYKLKQAIMELGPTGFPFERFVGELLKHQGYKVQVGVIVQGHCVSHEVDVVAEKDDRHYMVECKFHSDPARRCHVQVPLYVRSRFVDVERQWKERPGHDNKFHQGWVVTNTRFTSDAIAFGTCMGMELVSWDHPRHGSLRERVDASGLHPITCLSTLKRSEKERLLHDGVVLCTTLLDNAALLEAAGVKGNRAARILSEAKELTARIEQ